MSSIQDDHCAGLSDLYAFDTKFQTPQNYQDDDEHISEIQINFQNGQQLNTQYSIQNKNSLPKPHTQTLESLKQTQNSMTSSDSQTFTYGKEKNQCKNEYHLELKCVLFTLKDSLNMRPKNTTL